ncbi:hypothetical protein PLEOSDRAFT_155017 [Pleurotus ostreatus PC15]|uniref:SH3 domain-containing protein n=2 Tax=Pleurotus TaxID=5320 RepID=A0A067NQL6_PLEO1|nr:hypothetical protein CCMSSC00406_0000071 [Pleurotus cornucopiae]KDQ30333.1 hypothetical protein PLEOSDRAFT_155017 [Pleurotus ostreatus PC15]
MRAVREPRSHAQAMRSLRGDGGDLDAREPALINLPIPLPLPSIPLLAPILTNVIAGKPTTSSTPASTPTPTPTSSTGGNQNGGGTGGSTGGSNGGSTGGSSGGSTGGSSGGNSGSDGGSEGNGTGSGSGGSNGSSETDTGAASGGDGGGDNNGGGNQGDTGGIGQPSNASSTGGSPSQSSNGESAQGGSTGVAGSRGSDAGRGGGAPTSSNGAGGQSGSSSDEAGPPGVVNVSTGSSDGSGGSSPENGSNSDSGTNTSGPHAGSASSSSTTGSRGSSTTVNGNGNTGENDPPSASGSIAGSSGSSGLSPGAIAGIIASLVIVLLCLLVFLLRRRSIARRSQRRDRWWQHRQVDSPESTQATAGFGSGTASARSSFATTFDHGLSPHLTLDFDASLIPELPPMAEIRNSPNNSSPLTARGPVSLRPLLINVETERRASVYSAHSDSSEQDGQWLVIHPTNVPAKPRTDLLAPDTATPTDMPTPMSVRPFSPSESFSFPKPPIKRSSKWSESQKDFTSRPTSMKSTRYSTVTRKPVPTVENPFADPSGEKKVAGIEQGEFAEVEVIQRPFFPTLGDELGVGPGDKVRVVQSFDDGWAFVEKLVDDGQTHSGLIPIDCMRAEHQDLPTFLATKRVSSYSNTFVAL